MINNTISFSVYEVIALLGLVQSVYVLVFMGMKSGQLSRALIPSLFFITLSGVFFMGLAESRWYDFFDYYDDIKWLLWTLLFPLSALLVLQVARVTKPPAIKLWVLFTLIPIAYFVANMLHQDGSDIHKWLGLSSIIIGAISMLVIWSERQFLDELAMRKNGKQRYWIIMALIVMNVGLLTLDFILVNDGASFIALESIRYIIGISFVYLASTSLFRIYPQAVSINRNKSEKKDNFLSDSDVDIAMKIENLLHLEKVYQEPTYKRGNLAGELGITEAHLSNIVNIYFEKSVPQLLNTYRVKDAQYLLKQTDAEIAVVSEEAGFNSIATFNRVFKEIAGVSPSQYRQEKP